MTLLRSGSYAEQARMRLSETRKSVTHKAVIHSEKGAVKFFVTLGFFDDGQPGEVFITCDQAGCTLDGFSDCWAIAISFCLQYGVALEKLVKKFAFQEFEPKGLTDNPKIPFAKSVPDYVVRWIEQYQASKGAGQ